MHEALEAQRSISEDLEPAVVAMARRIMAVKELHTLPGKIQRAEGVSGHEEEDVQEPIAPPPQPEEQGWHAQPLFPARSLAVRKGKSKPQKPLNAAAQSSEIFLTSVPRMRLTVVTGCHVFYSGQCLYMCFYCG